MSNYRHSTGAKRRR